MSRKFELLLLKNTLAVAIPAIAVFAVLLIFLIKFPIFDQMECNTIASATDAEETLEERLKELYDAETYNVEIEPKNLYYTGFDYYSDGEKKGSYYYIMEKSRIYLYLLSSKHEAPHIEHVKIKAKIINDMASGNHILNALSEANGIEDFFKTGFYSNYIISELDYPTSYIRFAYIFYAIPMVICGAVLLYTLFVWINPSAHSQTRQLAAYGKKKKVIQQIDNQLRDEYVFKKGNIYITTDYMIVSYLARTDVIKLDMVQYFSKNEVENESPFGKKREVYRLTMSTPDILFYEVDFYSEGTCDEVMEYIQAMSK